MPSNTEHIQSLQQRIQELRVAHHEIQMLSPIQQQQQYESNHSSSSSSSSSSRRSNNNNVYIQLSSGSVAMLMDRSVAEARITRQIQNINTELEKYEEENIK